MSTISTRVIDVSLGKPAPSIPLALETYAGHGEWKEVYTGTTQSNGALSQIGSKGSALTAGRYRLTFQTSTYFQSVGAEVFYPYVSIVFEVTEGKSHYEIPLYLSPHGYSTFRS